MSTTISPAKIEQMIVATWPAILLLGVLLVVEFVFPGVLTQRYFNNVYVTDSAGQAGLAAVLFAGVSSNYDSNRLRLSALWLWLVLGALVAAAVADLWFADVIPRFYLISAILTEFGGAVFGVVLRPQFLAGTGRHIFDPAVSLANRLFRLGLVAIPVGFVLFVVISLYRLGAWRAVLDPHWRDWPLVVAVAWGLVGGFVWSKLRFERTIQQAS